MNNLSWKNWSLASQPDILIIQEDIIKKPDFIFSNPKEETEIIIEFMKDDYMKEIIRKKLKGAQKRLL